LTYTPLIAPLIVIEKATYGLTPEGIQEKIREIQIELYSLTAISSKKALGLPVSAEDNAKLFNDDGSARVPYLTQKLEVASGLNDGFFDVSEKVQLRVEESGGGKIDYGCDEDLNELFGNPNPGFPKQLRIAYTVLGHGERAKRVSLDENETRAMNPAKWLQTKYNGSSTTELTFFHSIRLAFFARRRFRADDAQ